ncbi:hypothetical protein [Halocatena salina]|uniref:Uncharacterized protein n=1 Tax=Halocatena salina TaxID=2934340 RepID=A0A8U0A1L2_9EURY|nr:hypothetical protein [Halocatena salina]UPM42746.1 hypothetical protein MW046_12405 [Halocatena salina]
MGVNTTGNCVVPFPILQIDWGSSTAIPYLRRSVLDGTVRGQVTVETGVKRSSAGADVPIPRPPLGDDR